MNENTSHIQSQKVVQKIYTNKQTVENNKIIKKNKYDQKIRKIAHVTEFAILNIFFINLIYQLKEKFKLKYLIISIILTFIYACTDEIHQIFVQGRTSSFIDVLIDTTGAITTSLIIYIIYKINFHKTKTS
jgi:acetobutylicum phosphotransbutyrylase BH3707